MTPPRTPRPVVSRDDLRAIADSLYPRASELARGILCRLRRRAVSSALKPKVAVVGRFSAGKSRFLNTLLNADLLPVDTDIVRLGVCDIAYGRDRRLMKLVRNEDRRWEWQRSALDELVRVAEQYRRNPETDPPRERYGILAPSAILRLLTFIDTPGYDSQLAKKHPEWALDLIIQACKRSDVCLLLLRNPADQADVDVVANVKSACSRIALVITKTDLWHPDDSAAIAEDSADTLEHILGYRPETFCVSSLWQSANAEERARMMCEHPLSLYGRVPRNDWSRLVGFLRHEAVTSGAWRLIPLLCEYRAALESVHALEQNYSRQHQAEHLLWSGCYELSASVEDDPLDVLTDATAAIRGRKPVPWRLLESVGIKPEHIAPDLRLRDGPGSLTSEIAARYIGALEQAIHLWGRRWPVALLEKLEQELARLDHWHEVSSQAEKALRPVREWIEWREMVETSSSRTEQALAALTRRWQRDPKLERQDVEWLLAELHELETSAGSGVVAQPSTSVAVAQTPRLA